MSGKVEFTKMQGLGNDYIYVNTIAQKIACPEKIAIRLSDRRFGIGSDGLILIGNSNVADFSMRIFNADGSEAKMCGNGSRCVGRYLYEKGLTDKTTIFLETLSGIKILRLSLDDQGQVSSVSVDMGTAELLKVGNGNAFYQDPLQSLDRIFTATTINMGNPHIVLMVDDADTVDVAKYGSDIEKSAMFPGGINVEFAQRLSYGHIRMRVWERGSGITMACGTGACATVVAFTLAGSVIGETQVEMDGGSLFISFDADSGKVQMRGPAVTVFEGSVVI